MIIENYTCAQQNEFMIYNSILDGLTNLICDNYSELFLWISCYTMMLLNNYILQH